MIDASPYHMCSNTFLKVIIQRYTNKHEVITSAVQLKLVNSENYLFTLFIYDLFNHSLSTSNNDRIACARYTVNNVIGSVCVPVYGIIQRISCRD
jgi:hypothetical protein